MSEVGKATLIEQMRRCDLGGSEVIPTSFFSNFFANFRTEIRTHFMKIATRGTLASALALLVTANAAFGVVDQTIQVQGTNLVLSWPSSKGYEQYMVQGRPSLDPSTPFVVLTNAYPANSTNRTTYVIPCCMLTDLGWPSGGGWSGGGGGGGEITPFPGGGSLMSMETEAAINPLLGLWAIPADGSGSPVPLAIYPPGFDTNDLLIFEPPPELLAETMAFSESASIDGGGIEPLGLTSGGCDCPDMGFFRVYHVPNFPPAVATYTFDGPIFIPVDFADYISLDMVDNVEILLDGQPSTFGEYTSYQQGTNLIWGVGLWADRLSNGLHTIQLVTTIRTTEDTSEGAPPLLVLSNLVNTIHVTNLVTFPEWQDLVNDTNYTFKAKLQGPGYWWIDIWDAWGGYIAGGEGYSADGNVSWTWDLYDEWGNLRDSLEGDPFYDSYITFELDPAPGQVTAAAQTTRPTPVAAPPYPSVGRWIICYLDTFYEPGTRRDIMTTGINGIAGGPAFRGIPVNVIPLKYGTNDYTQAQRNDSWVDLKASMFSPDARNLYYYGHGWANGFGGDLHTYSNNVVTGGTTLRGSKAFLSSQTVRDQITFNKYGGARPYRFVWLDGCSTANGDWANAFGVSKTTNSLAWYQSTTSNPSRNRPSAFVGWNQTVGGPGWGTLQAFFNCRTEWMTQWYYYWNTRTLVDALENGRQNSNWIDSGKFWGALRVYGFNELRMNQYNQRADWP